MNNRRCPARQRTLPSPLVQHYGAPSTMDSTAVLRGVLQWYGGTTEHATYGTEALRGTLHMVQGHYGAPSTMDSMVALRSALQWYGGTTGHALHGVMVLWGNAYYR